MDTDMKKYAAGPWCYDEPPTEDKEVIAIYDSKYFIKPLLFIGIWDSKVQKDVRVICWAYVNMPDVTGRMTPERKSEIINSLKLDHYQDDKEIAELLDHIDEQEKKIEALAELVRFAHDEGFDRREKEVWNKSNSKKRLAEIMK